MESSAVTQRVLMLLSLMMLLATGGVWWWASNEPSTSIDPAPQAARQQPISLSSSMDDIGFVDTARPAETGKVEIPGDLPYLSTSSAPLRLAAFEQPTQEPAPTRPSSALIPDAGVPVPAAASSSRSSEGGISYKGVLAFVNDVKVVAQADGVIREFLVDEGSIVERDKVIIEIDARLARAEQEVARKELESAHLKADDQSQILFAEAAEKVAAADYKRTEDLFRREVANIDEYERKQLEWQKAKLSIDVSKRERKINEAAVGVSEAKLNASGVQVELRTIRAPFAGIVAKTEKENFEWVKAGDEILRLVSLEKFRVRGRVQIDDSPNILERAAAKVLVQVKPGQIETVNGIVGFVEPETSVNNAERNEYAVWVEIENRVVNGQFLFRGKMDATVEIYPNR
jgi:multidrug efflux pump subunit AcrA (membrane-fusion protein)